MHGYPCDAHMFLHVHSSSPTPTEIVYMNLKHSSYCLFNDNMLWGTVVTWDVFLLGADPSGQQEAVVIAPRCGLDAHLHRAPAERGREGRGGECQARRRRRGLVQAPGQTGGSVASLPLVLDEEQDVPQGEGGLALPTGQQILLCRHGNP